MSDALDEPEIPINMIVEDGSCMPNANSYISLEDAIDYQTKNGKTDWLALSDNEKKVSLIKATRYIDSIYNWKGRRKFAEQYLCFPRVMLRDLDGFEVNGIPKQLKIAVCEAAYYGYQSELFSVSQNENGNIKRIKDVVSGAVEEEIEYFDRVDGTEVDYISKYAALNDILRGLYKPKDAREAVTTRACWGY